MAQPQQQPQLLRLYELRLLRSSLATPPRPSDSSPDSSSLSHSSDDDHHNISLHSHINQLLTLIETGNYSHALTSQAANLLRTSPLHDSSDLMDGVSSFLSNDNNSSEEERAILVLCFAVASFFLFIQSNFTGPPLPDDVITTPKFILKEENDFLACDDGCHLLGKLRNVEYLAFAKMLLLKIKDLSLLLFDGEIKTISWWLFRVLFVQQRILDELSSSLFDQLHVYMAQIINDFSDLEKLTSYWSGGAELVGDDEASAIVSMMYLEVGLMEYAYGRVDACEMYFDSAELVSGIHFSVTGVLGYRTVDQADPKLQKVLVADELRPSSNGSDKSQRHVKDNLVDQRVGMSDILVTPRLLENADECGFNASLTPIQQAMILARCLLIEKSSRSDELQRWDKAPYIEAFDSQPSPFFILRCFCDLLRIRWESTRSRTKVRALEMMEKLVEGIVREPFPGVAERIPLCFVAFMPGIVSLQKEYGELLVSCGLIGEAIKIFEALELWDNLIFCVCQLGKKAEAVELIKKRLSEIPNDPRLWCSLGYVTNNDSCYEKALEVSNNKSVRAKRSLARSAYNRGDYEASKVLWESAMALNSLYPDGWFALGAAALKARDVDKALYGYTQAVQLDPENGEAWNNIACLHMIKKKSKEAFIAFKEALKFKRDSWQMWENYSHVAMDVDNIRLALEAIQMVLHMTNSKRTDTELLERIMLKLEDESKVSVERSREFEQLLELLGEVLKQIVSSVGGADIWGLYARWHKIRGDLTMCSEALLKQVRSYQGLDLWKDKDRFKKFGQASLELCKLYVEISNSTGSRRELLAAEMHLKNIVRQGEIFSDTEEFKNLQAFLLEVTIKLQSDSMST